MAFLGVVYVLWGSKTALKGEEPMIWWVFLLVILTILSYLSDIGLFTFMQDLRIPFLNASLLSFLMLLCMLGLLGRMMQKSRKGEKETLKERVEQLEREILLFKQEQG